MNERINKEDLLIILNNLKIDREEFTVLSSSALVLRGIYDSAGDLDIAVSKKGLEELKQNYNLLQIDNWYKIREQVECIENDMEGNKEKVGDFYLEDINHYYEYLKSSDREKDILRIPIVEKYIKGEPLEYLDVYNNNGHRTGRRVIRGDKSIVLNEKEHIAVSVIFIENDKNEFLIQKTSKEKGGDYSSTGGHIDSGETPLEAIKRETKEEIGVDIDNDEIIDYGFLSFDMPLRFMFYVQKNVDTKSLKLQKEEVESVQYMSKEEIYKLIEEKKMLKSHGIMFKELMERRKEED